MISEGGVYFSSSSLLVQLMKPKVDIVQAVPLLTVKKSKRIAKPKSDVKGWYCEAGAGTAGNGMKFECGVTLCDLKETICGCGCVEISGAPYPEGYCGKVSPSTDTLSTTEDYRQWMFTPFSPR